MNGHPPNVVATNERNGKPKVSINEIASALSRKSSPSQPKNGFCAIRGRQLSHSGGSKPCSGRRTKAGSGATEEQERQQQEIQRIILAQAACQPMCESFTNAIENDESNGSPELDDVGILDSSTVNLSGTDTNGAHDTDHGADSSDGGLGPSDEQVRASMIHLLNPVLGSAFGSSLIEEGGNAKRKGDESGSGGASKKHRWMTVDELEESRFGRSKSYGRVHCKATYKCA
ncbi:hypothetical protein OSTOST_22655, partial [Ostertagia ostertagi]